MGHGVLPSVFKGMRHPSSYPTVIFVTFLFTIIAYSLIASVGYLAFGLKVEGNIIDNFPTNSDLTVCVALLTVITVITKYVLAAFPVCEGLLDFISNKAIRKSMTMRNINDFNDSQSERSVFSPEPNIYRSNSLTAAHRADYNIGVIGSYPSEEFVDPDNVYFSNCDCLTGIAIRTIVPCFAMALAFYLPNFIDLLSVIGAIFGSLISLVIPCLSYLEIFKDEIRSFERCCLYMIILMGVVLGFAVSLKHF
jgi:amino acid permease